MCAAVVLWEEGSRLEMSLQVLLSSAEAQMPAPKSTKKKEKGIKMQREGRKEKGKEEEK